MLALGQMQLWHWSFSPSEEKLLMLSSVSPAPLWVPASPGRLHPVKPSALGQDIVTVEIAVLCLISAISLVLLPFTPYLVRVDRGFWWYPSKTGGCKCTDFYSCWSPAYPARTHASSCQGSVKGAYICPNFTRSSVSQPRYNGLLQEEEGYNQASYPHFESKQ